MWIVYRLPQARPAASLPGFAVRGGPLRLCARLRRFAGPLRQLAGVPQAGRYGDQYRLHGGRGLYAQELVLQHLVARVAGRRAAPLHHVQHAAFQGRRHRANQAGGRGQAQGLRRLGVWYGGRHQSLRAHRHHESAWEGHR